MQEGYGTLDSLEERTGYEFDGWYTEVNDGEKIDTTTIVKTADNHTLYVHWTANNHTVIFNANGGSVSATSKKS